MVYCRFLSWQRAASLASRGSNRTRAFRTVSSPGEREAREAKGNTLTHKHIHTYIDTYIGSHTAH